MNGAHDLGGMMGLGPIDAPQSEPVFHTRWEQRMFAIMTAVGDVGGWSIDEDRAACENMAAVDYLSSSYYEHWLHGLGLLLADHTLAAGTTPTRPENVWAMAHACGSYIRNSERKAAFSLGEFVRVKQMHPETHTRVPRYLRGCVGEIIANHGTQVFPDTNALRIGENPQHLYGIRFSTEALWGKPSIDFVHADLWESYLEPR
jgi:nitrile hydratase subunit beta